MYWTFDYQGNKYCSWGAPRSLPENEISNLKSDFNIKIYNGAFIQPEDSTVMMMQGDSTLGLGDTIWLISYMRDVYRIKARRRGRFLFCSSPEINKFYSNFLPGSFELREEFIIKQEFDTINHKLPGMSFWTEIDADKSWVDNQSILERLYSWVGIEYEGLPDFGEFTNEKILYPNKKYYERLRIDPKDKYVFFQWHSSGHSKNLPPSSNIKLLKHITKYTGYKIYVIGQLKCLDKLEKISGVKNLSGKTNGLDVFTLAFNSEFIVCPDSAGIHLGEAYKIPAVGIMATLPPVYVASKYKIPAFMFGSGQCPYKPCGIVYELPRDKCPEDTEKYCKVLTEIDLNLFNLCLEQTYNNRRQYRSVGARNFYAAMSEPITLGR